MAGAACLAVAIAACSHESPVAPASAAAAACTYLVSPTTGVSLSVAGGTFEVSVNTASGCQWTASTSDAWIHPAGTSSVLGAGVVVMSVDSTSMSGRRGTVTVSWSGGSQSIGVSQGCTLSRAENVSPESQVIELSVGSCNLSFPNTSLSFDVPWIRLVASHGNGSLLDFQVDGNAGPERVGHISVNGGQITIIQGKGDCVTAIAPTSQAFDENGGTGSITVTAVPGCAWDATAHDVFGALTIASGGHGNGSGLVTFKQGINISTVAASPYLLVGGTLRFQITQSACPFTFSPQSFHVTAAGGSFSITVTTREFCRWTDRSLDEIITRPGEVRTGPGTIEFSVARNQTGQTRLASFFVNSEIVLVTQEP